MIPRMVIGFCGFFSLIGGNIGDAQENYAVGVARIDITPNYPVRLNGFGSRRDEPTGVSQRLWAKALAISQGEKPPVVIFSCDNLGIREPMLDEVAAELQRRFAIPRENITLTFTHTHCAPKVTGASDTIFSTPIPAAHQARIRKYSRQLTLHLIDVAAQAIESRAPATLEWTVGKVTFARNRRTPGGPVDHDLPVLVVRGDDGQPRVIYTTYACHCVTLSFNQYSGDWAGYAQEHIENAFPGCVAMVSIGCGSDSNPEKGVTHDDVVLTSEHGQEIATEVKRLLEKPLRPIAGELVSKLTHIEIPLEEVPTREQLEARAKEGGPNGFNAQSQLAKLDAGQELLAALHYPIHTVTFGDDLHMVFLAGEVCVDYSIGLKQILDRDRLWLHGYSNDFCSYIPSERLLQERGYGGGDEICYFDLPAKLKTGVEQQIVDAVVAQSPQDLQVKPGTQGIAPKSPEDSLRCMQTHDDLRIELVAAEPLVADPVAIDFGTDGRLWVAEMADYTRAVDEEFEPHGRVRYLTDDDGDGRFDRATDFLDGLRFPTDVKVWRDGVLVCDAPDILFAADRDGDGRAEIREVWFTGFATHNPHGRVNGLRFGLDGWVYGSGGLFGGKIKNRAGVEVDIENRDFRMKPDEGIIEGAMGQTQQGRPRDDWDNWFGCTNSQLLLHYPLREEYARRNPHVTLPPTIVSVPDAEHGEQLYPPGDLVTFKLTGAPGRPTSACGAEIYRDTYLGDEYYGNAFVCEPVNQLVHRMVLRPNGCTFAGSRHPSEAHSEFLTSTDRWFRPVQARTGPDGALWIVDMYRYVIEHPRWIPPETIPDLDLMAGQGLGRIYRVVRKDSTVPKPIRLESLGNDDLAKAIDSSNGVQRDLAEQMLVWRAPKKAPLELGLVLRWGTTPASRGQAASTLAALRELDADDVRLLLRDGNVELKCIAVRLAEPFLANDKALAFDIAQAVNRELKEDGISNLNPVFLAQIASSANCERGGNLIDATSRHIRTLIDDNYCQFAALSSIDETNAISMFGKFGKSAIACRTKHSENARKDLVFRLARVVALTVPQEDFHELFPAILPDKEEIFGGLEAQIRFAGLDISDTWLFMAIFLDAVESRNLKISECIDHRLVEQFSALIREANDCLGKSDVSVSVRIAAIELTGRQFDEIVVSDSEELCQKLRKLIGSSYAPEVQSAAMNAMLRCQSRNAVRQIIEDWNHITPRLRQEVIDVCLKHAQWVNEIIEGMERQVVSIGDFDAARRQKLLEHENEELRGRAEKIFGAVAKPNELVAAWEPALQLTGDAERGRPVYVKVCSVCHILDGVGHEVGPDVAALTNKTPQSILVSILDPNREVDGRYLSYSALTAQGKTISGLLVSETATSVTLREQGGKDHVILRQDLDELRTSRKSVMPEGLEKDLDQQSLADLIAYLMPQRVPPKSFDGNQPAIVRPDANGDLLLPASTAEIYGGPIMFESNSPFKNIGYWQATEDYAGWKIELDQPGTFAVTMDFACAPDSAGNGFRIDGGEPSIRGTVPSTGDWSKYQTMELGELSLPSGTGYLSVHFDGDQKAPALMDLREIRLTRSN